MCVVNFNLSPEVMQRGRDADHRLPSLRMSGATPPLFLYAILACIGPTLPFVFFKYPIMFKTLMYSDRVSQQEISTKEIENLLYVAVGTYCLHLQRPKCPRCPSDTTSYPSKNGTAVKTPKRFATGVSRL